ncbi:hypothetical protein DW2_01435 [Thioclava atlantica]|uniref:Uncharacterized protein n=2 Tax=Thioclava atlantica TaxID=1317124 RepID=A0A085U1D2_9RHOB|nr:hypothetical protein DW2_01435 [Thioclava atlantica]
MIAGMTRDRLVSLRLPADLIDAISRAARAADLPPAEAARHALRAGLDHLAGSSRESEARDAMRAALASARDWLDLQRRLRSVGFVLRQGRGGALAVHDWPANRYLLAGEVVGVRLADLVLRFRAPFPGHPGGATAPLSFQTLRGNTGVTGREDAA